MKHSIRISLCALIFFILITSFAHTAKTDYFANGEEEFKAGNYAKAVDSWKRVANSNVQAATKLGFMYECGLGVTRNYKTAKDLYIKAAAKGFDEAKMNLGLLLLFRYSERVKEGHDNFDIGVEYIMEANSWIKKQAEAGNARAQAALSILYKKGITVLQNYEQSYKLVSESAAQECAEGQYLLGNCYAAGEGCKKNISKAKTCWENAATQGLPAAQDSLGWLYHKGDDESKISKESQLAFYWFEKAAEQDWVLAQRHLGTAYFDGEGTAIDYEKARSWYEKAAAQGDGNACSQLGYMYALGKGCSQNFTASFSWYEKAAARGDPVGEFNLGLHYEYNYAYNGYSQATYDDYSKAREWYEKSANHGYEPGMYYLGEYCYYGRGGPKDLEKAKKWMEKAAQGNPDSDLCDKDRELIMTTAKEFLNTKF